MIDYWTIMVAAAYENITDVHIEGFLESYRDAINNLESAPVRNYHQYCYECLKKWQGMLSQLGKKYGADNLEAERFCLSRNILQFQQAALRNEVLINHPNDMQFEYLSTILSGYIAAAENSDLQQGAQTISDDLITIFRNLKKDYAQGHKLQTGKKKVQFSNDYMQEYDKKLHYLIIIEDTLNKSLISNDPRILVQVKDGFLKLAEKLEDPALQTMLADEEKSQTFLGRLFSRKAHSTKRTVELSENLRKYASAIERIVPDGYTLAARDEVKTAPAPGSDAESLSQSESDLDELLPPLTVTVAQDIKEVDLTHMTGDEFRERLSEATERFSNVSSNDLEDLEQFRAEQVQRSSMHAPLVAEEKDTTNRGREHKRFYSMDKHDFIQDLLVEDKIKLDDQVISNPTQHAHISSIFTNMTSAQIYEYMNLKFGHVFESGDKEEHKTGPFVSAR